MPAKLIEEFDLWQPGYGGATDWRDIDNRSDNSAGIRKAYS